MKGERFRYKGVEFPLNPKSLTVRRERRLARFSSPLAGNVIQDLGLAPVSVSGRGELCGPKAREDYRRLSGLFQSGGAGLLQLPGYSPIYAYFSVFSAEEEAGLSLIRYTFTFLEAAQEGAVFK